MLLYRFDIYYIERTSSLTLFWIHFSFINQWVEKLWMTSGKSLIIQGLRLQCLYTCIFILCNQEFKRLHECTFFKSQNYTKAMWIDINWNKNTHLTKNDLLNLLICDLFFVNKAPHQSNLNNKKTSISREQWTYARQ